MKRGHLKKEKAVAFCRPAPSTSILASTRAKGAVAPFQVKLENERGL